jgi:hypothetical protein
MRENFALSFRSATQHRRGSGLSRACKPVCRRYHDQTRVTHTDVRRAAALVFLVVVVDDVVRWRRRSSAGREHRSALLSELQESRMEP